MSNPIEYAAHQYAGLKGPRNDYDTTYYQSHKCKVYDAFVAGALAPETEAYYRMKFALVSGNYEMMPLPPPGDGEKLKELVVQLLKEGHKLRAVKIWSEYHPGLGLKSSLAKIREFENELKTQTNESLKGQV